VTRRRRPSFRVPPIPALLAVALAIAGALPALADGNGQTVVVGQPNQPPPNPNTSVNKEDVLKSLKDSGFEHFKDQTPSTQPVPWIEQDAAH
jgi:hypothetical protein